MLEAADIGALPALLSGGRTEPRRFVEDRGVAAKEERRKGIRKAVDA